MKPVTQSRTGRNGTCFRACLASLLEVPERAVPDFKLANQDPGVDRFLAGRGLRYVEVPVGDVAPTGWHVITGTSPRGGQHAVVGKDGKLAHDPHPHDGTGRGLVREENYGLLLPLSKTGNAKDAKVAYVIYRPPGSNAGVVEVDGQRYYIDATRRLVNAGYELDVSKRKSTNSFSGKSAGEVQRWMRSFPVHSLSGSKTKDEELPPHAPGDVIKLKSGKRTTVKSCKLAENLFHEPEWHVATTTGEALTIPALLPVAIGRERKGK